MKSLIVTVAGTASRFNKDTEEETLKCIYNVGGAKNSLLYHILDKARDFDEFVIVGGFLFHKLEEFVNQHLSEFRSKIRLVYNPEYASYGSGYSLIVGLQNMSPNVNETIFVEGDLYFDAKDFNRIVSSPKSVITVNHELITAKKAVVVYERLNHMVRYLYDSSHSYLRIDEPFLAIYNSGQVWKFTDIEKLFSVLSSLTPEQTRGTNLEIIQGYFGDLTPADYEIMEFSTWHNCNTVSDYNIVHSKISK